jgi:hypothetical protein
VDSRLDIGTSNFKSLIDHFSLQKFLISQKQGVFIGFLIFFVFVNPNFEQPAFSDGLSAESLPPASIGNRQASLFVKINPPILVSGQEQDTYVLFRLYDANTNQTIEHTTYQITITKGTSPDQRPLVNDFFHAHNGVLKLKIEPRPGELTIFGDRDPFQNALVADPGGNVLIRGPLLLDGGLYHFHIEIFGIDNDRNIFKPEDAPKFDSYLSVGDVFKENITYNNTLYNTTLISYYDRIHDFDFDPTKLVVSWGMPFDWNLSRIKAANIFVHEEFKVPKNFTQFSNNTSFNATVNGQPVLGRSLAIDPFTSEYALIIHYLLTKNDIIKLAEMSNATVDSNNTMKFTLMPKGPESRETSTDLITDTGGMRVALLWTPNPPIAGSEATLMLNITDAITDSSLRADVNYNLTILDSDGKVVIKKENLVAANGTDSQNLIFPENGRYQIEIFVKSLKYVGQAFIDTSRTGVARGSVIVS